MFLHFLFLVALLQLGESQNGARKPTTLNNSTLDLNLGDQCVTRDELRTEMQSLTQLVVNNTALLQELLSRHPLGSYQNPVNSCRNIPQGSPSGYYWIQTNSRPVMQQYCDMSRTCCNSRGGWLRVANLDMTDPHQQCPSGFRYDIVSSPRRLCGRTGPGCTTVTYPVHGVEYSRVCGRVIGYQLGSPDAFNAYISGRQTTIDGYYVDGVSLTHGSSPRKHIWTFAAAVDETRSDVSTCPCTRPDLTYTPLVPPFVGNDYFCETGSRYFFEYDRLYNGDSLWDGQGCGPQSTCCSFNNPPWFCKQLPQPTRDDIELRLCKDQNVDNEDIPLEVVELFVQ